MSLKCVFFDLDGTLLDTSKDLGCALNHLLESQGLEPLAHERIRPHVSNGANALIALGFGDNLEDKQQLAYRTQLLAFYLDNIATYTHPFDGIENLIEQCARNKISWGIVTNKPKAYTLALMDKIKFASKPSAMVCPDHLGISKPNPEPLLHACKLSSCTVDEAVYIGDHLRDIECGHNAKMDTIAVGYGFTLNHDEHLQWNATHSVNNANEIWPILNTHYLTRTT